MRAKVSVRISKFLHTLLRNMRRRRKTSSFPSLFPLLLLLGLIALLRTLKVSTVSDNLPTQNNFVTDGNHETTVYEHVKEEPVPVTGSNAGAPKEKRVKYMERRHAERRAMHRRIDEKQREQSESPQHPVPQVARDQPVLEKPGQDSGAGKEKESEKAKSEGQTGGTSGAGPAQVAEGPRAEERSTARQESSRTGERNSSSGSSAGQTGHMAGAQGNEAGVKKMTEEASSNSSTGTSIAGVPAGARVHGKLSDYAGSLGGTVDGMLRGQNVTRVSYTLFKILKLFGFVSMIDSPAGSHSEWMPELVERMTFDHPSFRYIGVDDVGGIEKARRAVGDVVDGEFIVGDVEQSVGNSSDVVFHWTEMDGGVRDARDKGYMEHIRKVIVAAKKGDNGYIVFGQFPRLNGPQPTYRKGKWVFAGDEKEEPFLYNEHIRGVVPIGNGRESYMLYMTFYSLRSMPMSELQI